MYISPVSYQQNYNQTFKGGKTGKKGGIIGGIAGLAMCGAMMATCPVGWQNIKGWPIVGIALTTAGAYSGKLLGDVFENNNKHEK